MQSHNECFAAFTRGSFCTSPLSKESWSKRERKLMTHSLPIKRAVLIISSSKDHCVDNVILQTSRAKEAIEKYI